MNLPSFTGEIGGLLAGAFMTGISIGWGLCVKIRLTPLSQELAEAKLELRQFLEAAKAKFLSGL